MDYINQKNFENLSTLMTLPFCSTELQGYFFQLNCQVSAISTKTAKPPYWRNYNAKLQDILM